MDWEALQLSAQLAICTAAILIPAGIVVGRFLAWREFPGKGFVEAALALPLVLPPTVFGYYLLVGMGGGSDIGRWYEAVIGHPLVFTFQGLLVASVLFNIPFAVQPIQRAFQAIPEDVRHAAACCGLSRWRTLMRIELPLAWTGLLSALVMTFAHTLGEFGVVLMVGGSIPGETKTIAISIYDRVQAFDDRSAATMSAFLLAFSFIGIGLVSHLTRRIGSRHG